MKVQILKGKTTEDMTILLNEAKYTLRKASNILTGTESANLGIFSSKRFVDFFLGDKECRVDFESRWSNELNLEHQIRERVAKVKEAFSLKKEVEINNANYFAHLHSGVLSQVILRATLEGGPVTVCLRDFKIVRPYELSKILIRATEERSDGIFSIRRGIYTFHRGDKKVDVHFNKSLNLGEDINKIIRERISLVEHEFAKEKATESQEGYYLFTL